MATAAETTPEESAPTSSSSSVKSSSARKRADSPPPERADSPPAVESADVASGASSGLTKDKAEVPRFDTTTGWWQKIFGDFINTNLLDANPDVVRRHRKGNEAAQCIICLFGLCGSFTASLVVLETSYAMGVIPVCFGVFYVLLPHDLIRDDLIIWGIPIGKFDDAVAVGLAAAGVLQVCKAHHDSPMEREWNVKVICAVIALLIATCFSVKLRWFVAGFWALFAQATIWPQVIPSHTISAGVILYMFGFLYNLLPVDLLNDDLEILGFRVGKFDDYILGYFPVIAGVLFTILGSALLPVAAIFRVAYFGMALGIWGLWVLILNKLVERYS